MKMRLSMSLDMGTSEMVSKAYKAVGAQSDYILGNLHLNIVAAAYTPEIEAALEPFVYELVGKSVLAMVHNVICSFSISIIQGVYFCRARYRGDEDTCTPILEEFDEHRVDEEDQSAVRP